MKESVRILRFAIVGSSNALITALVIWILMDILDCNYLWSNMAGYFLPGKVISGRRFLYS